MNPALQNILSRLQKVKKVGNGWQACCPAHADRDPSLRVDEGRGGRVLLNCFAGCSPQEIVKAIGLEMTDLFPPRPQSIGSTDRNTYYNYKDASGELLFRVVRTPDKKFFQQRPDNNGGWVNGLGGIRPVLYRLPELSRALETGETVFVPEGEKDVNNLIALGLTATCNPMGAGKWRPWYSDSLKGANAVLLPDNDEPGRQHTRQVARSLKGKAKSVKVLELPGLADKGDVSDWLANGGTKDELLELAAAAPVEGQADKPRPLAICLGDVEPEEVSWLWEPYLPLGKLTLLEGDPGVGKTWAALQIAANVTKGDPFPEPSNGIPDADKRQEPAHVIYMSAEDGLGDTLRPRLDKVGADPNKVIALAGKVCVDPATGEEQREGVTLEDIPILEETLKTYKPRLLIVDPLQAYLGAKTDMHRANEVRPILSNLATIAEEHKVAVLLIRHLAKGQTNRAMYRGLGSIDFTAAARSVLLVGQDPENPEKRALIQIKSSLAPMGAALGFEILDGEFWWTGLSSLTAEGALAPAPLEEEKSALDEAKDFLLVALVDGPTKPKEVYKQAKSLGISERTLRRARNELGAKAYKDGAEWYWSLPAAAINP